MIILREATFTTKLKNYLTEKVSENRKSGKNSVEPEKRSVPETGK